MTPTPPALADSQPVPVSFREQWAGFSNISQWPIEPSVATDLERSDWTPEEALRWYAAGKHYDTVPNGDGSSSARILDNGAVASNALKSLSRAYAEHKGDVALLETKADSEQDEGVSREQWIAQAMRVYLIAGDTEEQAHSCASYLWGELNMDDLDDPYEAALNDVEGRQSPPQADSPPAPIVGRKTPGKSQLVCARP